MTAALVTSHWDDRACKDFTEEQLLLYRSNLLGGDLRITNFAGGNTSAKLKGRDPLTGAISTVLWVKGSGGDLGSMQLDGFATLYLDRVLALEQRYRGKSHEDEMQGYLPHCNFNLNARAASIDTPLHAFAPHDHIDHVHPDSVIALACAKDGERLTAEVFGGVIGWLPWQRPGFHLGLAIGSYCRANPRSCGVVLGGHGLLSFGDTSRACYENTITIIQQAEAFLLRHHKPAGFGGLVTAALPSVDRRAIAAAVLPSLRGLLAGTTLKIGHFIDSDAVLEFVGSRRAAELAAAGTSCPDHFLRTKRQPLLLPAATSPAGLLDGIDERLAAYRAAYTSYYERCKRADSPALRDTAPVVLLAPGIGMFTFANDKATARIAAEFYTNAIHVMRGASDVSDYLGLPESEAFAIEYWALEEAKLRRMPPPKPLVGRIAFVTGGAGGIGVATAERLLAEGAAVMLADINSSALENAKIQLRKKAGEDQVDSVLCDVTQEASVQAAFAATAQRFGGLDILVSNAGIASSAPIEDTSLDLWNKNLAVLATGYFLVAREGFKVMKQQGLGGSIVFVGSKNALAASIKSAAYNTAKAAELHLARCIALEGAPLGIRCNVVNPDAVLRGSHIWSGDWRSQRAAAYGIEADQLEQHYRERSLLKRSVYPEDIAEAIAFFAGDRAAKSTGNILNVDAGNAAAFTR
jgi:rhamnulose-1-phosphate aldolase/alcohol dehydrogenase